MCDDLIKYECIECGNQSIVSAFAARNKDKRLDFEYNELICPFCDECATGTVGPITADEDFLASFGCLGIHIGCSA